MRRDEEGGKAEGARNGAARVGGRAMLDAFLEESRGRSSDRMRRCGFIYVERAVGVALDDGLGFVSRFSLSRVGLEGTGRVEKREEEEEERTRWRLRIRV
jgi:hypothetical protein